MPPAAVPIPGISFSADASARPPIVAPDVPRAVERNSDMNDLLTPSPKTVVISASIFACIATSAAESATGRGVRATAAAASAVEAFTMRDALRCFISAEAFCTLARVDASSSERVCSISAVRLSSP